MDSEFTVKYFMVPENLQLIIDSHSFHRYVEFFK